MTYPDMHRKEHIHIRTYKVQFFSSPSDLMKSTVVDESLSTIYNQSSVTEKTTSVMQFPTIFFLVNRAPTSHTGGKTPSLLGESVFNYTLMEK